jgi:hypothetical protein
VLNVGFLIIHSIGNTLNNILSTGDTAMNNDKVSVSGADNQKQNSKTGWLTKV